MANIDEFTTLEFTEVEAGSVPPPETNPTAPALLPSPLRNFTAPSPSSSPSPPPNDATSAEDLQAALMTALKISTDQVAQTGEHWKNELDQAASLARDTVMALINPPTDYSIHISERNNQHEQLQLRLQELENWVAALERGAHAGTGAPRDTTTDPAIGNWKGNLQERCSLFGFKNPMYAPINEGGDVNSPQFTVSCSINEIPFSCVGTGPSIKTTHQNAALQALKQLNWPVCRPKEWEKAAARCLRQAKTETVD